MTNEEKTSQLKHILNSEAFKKSPTSSRLLQFLVTSTINGKELKETTVGIELFGQNFLKDENSSRIRVNIYNLRKKLESYYDDEGINDSLKIEIRKGQYYTQFITNKEKETVIDYKKKFRTLLTFSALLFGSTLFFIIQAFYKPPVPIWNAFFKNKKETILVVGDFFGILGKTATGKIGWNRDYNLNSPKDFYSYKKKHPELDTSITPSTYTYLTGMGPIATNNISKLFTRQKKDFTIRFSSKLDYKDIKENNTIYIGPIKNENKFLNFITEKSKNFNLNGNQLHYKNIQKKKDTIIDLFTTGENREYAIVSRIKGIDKDIPERFLFFSNHDIGVVATVEYFINYKTLKAFQKQYLVDNESFTAVFLVEGKERTNLGLKLVLVDSEKAD